MFLELAHPLASQSVDLRCVHHTADGVYRLLVHQQLKLDKLALAPSSLLVIKSCITFAIGRLVSFVPLCRICEHSLSGQWVNLRSTFELPEEVVDQLRRW